MIDPGILAAAAALPVSALLLAWPHSRRERLRALAWIASLLPVYVLAGLHSLPNDGDARSPAPSEEARLESAPDARAAEPGARRNAQGPQLIERPAPDPRLIRARTDAQDANETDPEWHRARNHLRSLYQAGDFERLAHRAEDEALRFPHALEAHALAGLAWARLGETARAQPHLRVVSERGEVDPNYRMALLTLRMMDPHDRGAAEGPSRRE